MNSPFFLLLIITGLTTQAIADESLQRWYSPEQVKKGTVVFKNNCAVCHGEKAEKTINWKQQDANGFYPPPPLNGTAHAWHHSLKILRQSVRDGGTKIGGKMPAFEKVLSAEEIDSAIAYFQSQWPNELYNKWSNNFTVKPLKTSVDLDNPVFEKLKRRLNNPNISEINPVANGQFLQIKINDKTLYLTKDGQYAVIGDVIDLESGESVK